MSYKNITTGTLVYNIFDKRKIDQRKIGIIIDTRPALGSAKVLWPGKDPVWIRKDNLEMVDAAK
tara:strand:+ start:205 stop:396 length:192 start_codon:yes stop_codon:yes gene_type:complete